MDATITKPDRHRNRILRLTNWLAMLDKLAAEDPTDTGARSVRAAVVEALLEALLVERAMGS